MTDLGFVPSAPLNARPAAYEAGATYAANALVTDNGQVYRSQAAGNKGNTPHEDADFVHWAPVSVSIVPLQNPNWNHAATAGTEQAHSNLPPARSDAAAAPLETIGTGVLIGLGE